MNERGAELLIEAGLAGRRQAFGMSRRLDPDGVLAVCALQLLAESLGLAHYITSVVAREFELRDGPVFCPACGIEVSCDQVLLIHMNDGHGLDFLTIGRKMMHSGGRT